LKLNKLMENLIYWSFCSFDGISEISAKLSTLATLYHPALPGNYR